MPNENDGLEGASEQVQAQTTETPQPAAPPVDEEKIKLRQEIEQHKAALNEVAQMVQSGRLRLADQQPASSPQEEDESALIDRKELKKLKQELVGEVAQAFNQTTAVQAGQLRLAQVELLRPKLKNFDKYESEIEGLLSKMDPRVAAQPQTIKQVYQIVRSSHIDEEIETEIASRSPQPIEDMETGWEADFVEPESTPKPSRASQQKPSAAPRGGVAPAGDASASRPAVRRHITAAPISREERAIAEVFGIKSAEEYRKYADKGWRPDMTGFKGRQRV